MMSAQEDNDNDILMDNELIPAGQSAGTNSNSSSGPAIFPLARIKKIMKADKDVNLVAADAVNLISLATELFLDSFVKKASEISQNEKRRTILYKDFASAVKQDIRYSFLQELVPETVSIQAALDAQKHHGMVQSVTPNHSPVMDTDDHFDSFKTSSSNINGAGYQQTSRPNQSISQASSNKTSKSSSEFFAKRTPGNVNFLLNHASISIDGVNSEVVDINDDTVNS